MQRRAVRLRLDPPLVANRVLCHRLRPELTIQHLEVVRVAGEHLNPQVAHLVPRALPPENATRRLGRIARVVSGVVVRVPHLQTRPLGQPERRDVAVHVLPAEIPIANVDQRTHRSVGQLRKSHHLLRAVVSVWLHGLDFHIHGSDERVGDDVFLLASGDVDALPTEPQHRRRPLGRIAPEVEPDRRLNDLLFPARLHVQLDHQVGVRLQRPGEPLG